MTPQQRAERSLIAEVEAAIRRSERQYARLVLADFREALQRTSNIVKLCLQWQKVYKS